MKKIKNYKKAIVKTSILIATILLLAISLNSSFATTVPINNTTPGGINGTITSGTTNPGDTILLAPGNYTGTTNTGITINKNVTIQGNGPATDVVIDAEGQRRIFNIGNNLNVTFINITFTNGYIAGNGGAISNAYAATTMTFINCTFTNNNATVYGGAIYNPGANMRVSGSTFINNTANSDGGAINNNGANMNVSDSTFTNNTSPTNGGAISSTGNNININGSTFTNNKANMGGVISVNYCTNGIVSGSTFINNSATSQGGAIYLARRGANYFSVIGSNFTNNKAPGSGGAIYSYSNSYFSVSGSTFINNTATVYSSGAIYSSGANFSVRDSTFISNTANSNAGAIYCSGDYLDVSGSTFINNTANSIGGAIYCYGSSAIVNYNYIFNNIDANGFDIVINDSGRRSNANLNWWGKNNISDTISGVNTSNHYILNITNSSTLDNVQIGNNVSFSLLVLNTTLNNAGVANLPDFVINGTFNGAAYNSSRNGNFTYVFTILSGGIQTVDASSDDQYVNITFYTIKGSTNSTIVVSPNLAHIGENVTVSGVLANHTGISSVNVTVDGTLFNVSVDGFGYWELNYNTNRTGTFDIVVSFADDGNYDAFSNSTTFTVNKSSTNSTIVVSPNLAHIGENVTVSGVLANFTGIGFVNVTVDGNLFTDVIVDVFGYWELNCTTNRTGTDLEIVVSFAGNENYISFTNTTSFNVTKLAVNSTMNVPGNVKVGKTITIDGVLVDENGDVIANAPIAVTVDGKVYSLTTDSNGRWSLTYKPNHTGSINAMVDYAGNDKYFSYTNTTTFNVVKGQVIVDIDVVKNSDGSVDVIVTVSDEDGDSIPDYKVSVDLDGKYIGDIVTDVFGVGRIHISTNKLSVGRHVITVSSDDVNYNVNPVSVEFETQNNNNDSNNTNKTNNNPVATATMKNTGIPIIAIILVLISVFGISIRRKED
ncbi:beta strand repeat-containing protein [Methanobrevibacter cuticularis]|uniref:beta strand repeat-containing protein n=1 Tax=Methanobrevibacter cuticularis TaxID=47311 RepID=UPI001471A0CC|nr:hypothetical protein [Methanobrevibacter cuticularis]